MWAILLLALATLAALYILVGYPLALALIRWRTAPPVRKDLTYTPTVTAIMAVHNGAKFLRAKLDFLLQQEYPQDRLQIIVISDESTDATDAIAASYADRGVQLVRVPKGGKSAALNHGLARATGEVIFFCDVRQALHPQALRQLVASLADPTVGAVTGELRILNSDRSGEQADLDLYWRYELWARRQQSQIDSVFNVTGCIYVIRRELAEPVAPDTLGDDNFFPLRPFLRGYRTIFEPEAVAFDFPTESGGEFRRKMRTLAGVWQAFARMPQLFGGGNRMRLHFLSHKFGRLALPWILLIAVGATFGLPSGPAKNFLLADEAVLLLLAALDAALPKGFVLKRLTSPARSFLTMNAAALCSVAVFFVKPEKLWRPTRVLAEQVGNPRGGAAIP